MFHAHTRTRTHTAQPQLKHARLLSLLLTLALLLGCITHTLHYTTCCISLIFILISSFAFAFATLALLLFSAFTSCLHYLMYFISHTARQGETNVEEEEEHCFN